jgi:hypothetical protein
MISDKLIVYDLSSSAVTAEIDDNKIMEIITNPINLLFIIFT